MCMKKNIFEITVMHCRIPGTISLNSYINGSVQDSSVSTDNALELSVLYQFLIHGFEINRSAGAIRCWNFPIATR